MLLIEIIKHRYKVDSPDAKLRFMEMIMERVKRDRSKQAALKYLEEFEGKFWNETDERVREITRSFERQMKAEAAGKLSLAFGEVSTEGGGNETASSAERKELVNRFQRIVNETQLPRLNQMMNVLNHEILDSPQHYTYLEGLDGRSREGWGQSCRSWVVSCGQG